MEKDKLLSTLIFLYVGFMLVQNIVLYITIQDYTSTKEISTKASAQISFCKNYPPSINYTCNETMYEGQYFNCTVQGTDPDNTTNFTWNSGFVNPPELFNISPTTGRINFTANYSRSGNHSFTVTIFDNSGCTNQAELELYAIEIFNVNMAPYLVKTFADQEWVQDTSIVPFDLDDYFADDDGDTLVYTSTILTNIFVDISENNEVTFTPETGWSGTEIIYFFAWDPYNANATSNNVTLTVTPVEEASSSSSGGGGGGGGGGSNFFDIPTCIPLWYCRPWEKCQPDGFQVRECYDLKNCSNEYLKPNTTQQCDFISTCYDGFKGPDEEYIDCGGPCPPCGTCYDSICNNNEDCTKGLTEIPDCGGPCGSCPLLEQPVVASTLRYGLLLMILLSILLVSYTVKKSYPYLMMYLKRRRKIIHEEKLFLTTKITESILDSLIKIQKLLDSEKIEKIIVMFSMLVRKYFKNLFDLGYEFTYEEITKEIDTRKISHTFKLVLKKFFERSMEIEFSGKSVTTPEMRAMISEFKAILSITCKDPLKTKEKLTVTGSKQMNIIGKLFNEISEAEYALRNKDLNTAHSIYLTIHSEFKLLDKEEKIRLHGFISRLYEEIKLARETYVEVPAVK